MKRLLIMRHGHSPSGGDIEDHDRPLSIAGQQEASLIAQKIVLHDLLPHLMLVSTAKRTQETAAILQHTWSEHEQISQQNLAAFYLAGLSNVQRAIEPLTRDIQTLLLLGHNPGWSDIVYQLSGASITLSTANLAIIEHTEDISWRDAIQSSSWTLNEVLRPSHF